jgi:beta-N-acetylhexosaminidase
MHTTRTTPGPAALAIVLTLVLAACTTTTPTPTPSPVAIATPSPVATAAGEPSASPAGGLPSAKPTPASSPRPTPRPTSSPVAAASCVDRTLDGMTEAQRIGQLFMVGLAKDQLDAATRSGIATWHFGSVTFTTQTSVGATAIRSLTRSVQALSTRAATAHVGFLVAANQEGGKIQGLAGSGFSTIPSALTQGTFSSSTLTADAERWGRQLLAAGVEVNFAPVADVVPPGTDAQNAPIGQLQREFAHDPSTVATHVRAFIAGMAAAGIITTAKHFPGLGRVEGNTDFTGDVVDDVTTRNDPYLAPFEAAVAAHVPFVMVSLATYEQIDPDHLAVFSPTVIDGMLRGDLGFKGVVTSDALGAAAVASIPAGTRAVDFITAGGDLIVVNQVPAAIEMAGALASQAASSPSFARRIDVSVRRILEAKDREHLLPC